MSLVVNGRVTIVARRPQNRILLEILVDRDRDARVERPLALEEDKVVGEEAEAEAEGLNNLERKPVVSHSQIHLMVGDAF